MRTGKYRVRSGINAYGHKYWWYVLVGTNGKTLDTSEMYVSKQGCLRGVDAAKRTALTATIEEVK